MFFLKRFKIFFCSLLFITVIKTSISDTPKFTEAHKLLVSKKHLENLITPTKLKYIFKKTGTLEPGFNDRVIMVVSEKDKDGYYNIGFDFFSGYNKEDLTSAKYKFNNPIIHAFWDHDIATMTRITKGSVIYFRKRITWSLSDENKFNISDATCEYNGKQFKGKTLEHTPYEEDYDSKKFIKYAKKKYYVTTCDEIPGMIYQIKTIIPSEDSKKPLMKEILTFEKILN
tara:strand:- start:70 stop:753 length:684 start_codon:yes stop_codon:yes gene_type:complete